MYTYICVKYVLYICKVKKDEYGRKCFMVNVNIRLGV